MLNCFPSPLPDELLYSWLARYYVKSGYMAYTVAAEDLFSNIHTKPSIEFITALSSAALEAIERYIPRSVLIEKHTMFPYYARFLNRDRRNRAFDALVRMKSNYINLICFPKSKEKAIRNLRYCPMCAYEDRNVYGETYWHRTHQLTGVSVCPVHGCELVNTSIEISSKGSPSLITAEETVTTINETRQENQTNLEISQYVTDVFLQPVDMQNDIDVGQFLHSRLEGTVYLSQRGEKRNIQRLHYDIFQNYQKLPDGGGIELWQIQKIFNGYRHGTYEICLIALMLGISSYDLTHMTLPEQSQSQRFDEQIKTLHSQGVKYPEIAKRLNSSYDVVKAIGEGLYGCYHNHKKTPKKGGFKKKLNWAQLDSDTLPEVKRILNDLLSNSDDRPERISIGRIETILGWSSKRLHQCPLCLEEVNKHTRSQEDYWRKLVYWAENKLISEGKTVSITALKRLTNMRKRDFERIGYDFSQTGISR